ncbi:TetR family transcriptional regulator [Demetria terragena]|uniref:TetR family transcriptional regulator n=1 Tax=Demetria terragena TaxID=63959 RepID=UPI0003789B51|nr:TetR/AcrR family transcriptional regulator C-terminal domain-containing protein [Demetria terragena]
MPLQRRDVLHAARGIVREFGLGDLTMRRLAKELGVAPGAIYWHVPHKQALLAELADDLLAEVPLPDRRLRWDRQLHRLGLDLRNTLLAQRDGAELVSAGRAAMLDTSDLGKRVVEIVESANHPQAHAHAARDALLHFVIGFTLEEQTHATMAEHGAVPARIGNADQAYEAALTLIVRGVCQ